MVLLEELMVVLDFIGNLMIEDTTMISVIMMISTIRITIIHTINMTQIDLDIEERNIIK